MSNEDRNLVKILTVMVCCGCGHSFLPNSPSNKVADQFKRCSREISLLALNLVLIAIPPVLQAVLRISPNLDESPFFRALHGQQLTNGARERCTLLIQLASQKSTPPA